VCTDHHVRASGAGVGHRERDRRPGRRPFVSDRFQQGRVRANALHQPVRRHWGQ